MQDSFSLGQLLGTLWRRWKIIVFGTLAFAVLGIVLALVLPRRYSAGASILPEQEENSLSLGALLGQAGLPFASSMTGLGASAQIQKEILFSFTLARRVVEALNLYVPYDLEAERKEDPHGAELTAVARLKQGLSVEILPPSQTLMIVVESDDPVLSRDIARCYIDELERFNREQNQAAGGRKRAFLATRLAGARADLAAATEAMSDFSARNGVVHLPSELEGELSLVAELNRRLILKELERAGLAQDVSGEAPAIKRLDSEIQVLKSKLAELKQGGEESGFGLKGLSELPELSLEYYALQRDIRIQEEIIGLLTQQLEQAKLQESSDIFTLKVLDPPILPTLPSWPPKKLVAAGVTLLGFVLLCCGVLVREWLRRVREDHSGRLASWRWLLGKDAERGN